MTKDCSEYSLVNISGSIEYVLTVKSLQTNKRTPDKVHRTCTNFKCCYRETIYRDVVKTKYWNA